MKKIVFLFALVVMSFFTAQAQETPSVLKKNTLYATFGGNSETFYMLHYDRIFWHKNLWKIAGNVGAGYYSESGKTNALSFSGGGSLLFGKTHHAELSLGYRHSNTDGGTYVRNTNEMLASLGYRFQREKGGFFATFRTGLRVGANSTKHEYTSENRNGNFATPFLQIGLGFIF